jgi:tripartite-type tricarboxylate transporter receptor subunit TctC
VKTAWERQGAEPMVMAPEQFGAHIGSEIEKWARIIHANAIKGE